MDDSSKMVPSQSKPSFRSYRAFSFSSSKAPTRLPVGVGGVETGFLEARDREESFGPIPVEIGSTVAKLCTFLPAAPGVVLSFVVAIVDQVQQRSVSFSSSSSRRRCLSRRESLTNKIYAKGTLDRPRASERRMCEGSASVLMSDEFRFTFAPTPIATRSA